MHTHQALWTETEGWTQLSDSPANSPNLVLIFGSRGALSDGAALEALAKHWPRELFYGCSTAGEIEGTHVRDGSVVATAVWFETARVETASLALSEASDNEALGRALAAKVPHSELSHVFVLSDGTHVNGSELVRGLTAVLPPKVTLTGGLSGDGTAFASTVVCHAGQVSSSRVSLVAFYGVNAGIGSLGGWDSFGTERNVTKSRGNVLFELDGEPALALYKRYLAEHAAGLPSSGLRFPLLVRMADNPEPVVRTLLAVNEADGSMTLAGDIPQGSTAQLMRANFDRLVGGAQGAAMASRGDVERPAELAILISCVGRKLVLKQRIEEEVEAVRDVLGESVPLAGFYSYGELAPFKSGEPCRLHNQTMTITTLREAA